MKYEIVKKALLILNVEGFSEIPVFPRLQSLQDYKE